MSSSLQFDFESLDKQTIEILREEFDYEFYLSNNPDVKRSRVDPLVHYINFGATELRDPSLNFSTEFYVSMYKNLIPPDMHPFVHYVLHGKKSNLASKIHETSGHNPITIKKYFDSTFYLGQNTDVQKENIDPLLHFLNYGHTEDRDPSATFSVRWYRERFMKSDPVSTNPFVHFITYRMENVYISKIKLRDEEREVVSRGFDADYYSKMYLDHESIHVDPLQYFLTVGWMLGHDPNNSFSTTFYAKIYRSQIPRGVNPFVHYWTKGKKSGFLGSHRIAETSDTPEVREFFDSRFYLTTYQDVRSLGLDPFHHYMTVGWREGRDPSPTFSSVFYGRAYPDVAESGLHPLAHYASLDGQREAGWCRPHLSVAPEIERYSDAEIAARQQDLVFPLTLETSKKIIALVVPEHNEMSGGIFSMFSIANRLRETKSRHGYDVIILTNPNPANHTYCRQINFRNKEDVFRFEQIIYCKGAEEIYLHIPEYATDGFISRCSGDVLRYLISRKKLNINILNQNIELMPKAEIYAELRHMADELTQSVAHHAYFSQEHADRYQLPTLLLPAYTDLSNYASSSVFEKEDLIIYSLDEAWYKAECLDRISFAFPHYKLVEIRSIPFDHYMDLATRCRFSISFGEGFDGYVAQPIYQGGIGFTVYKEDFFPSEEFLRFPNFFRDPQSLLENIIPLMQKLLNDPKLHESLNIELIEEYNKLYSLSDYHKKIDKLASREFEIYPSL